MATLFLPVLLWTTLLIGELALLAYRLKGAAPSRGGSGPLRLGRLDLDAIDSAERRASRAFAIRLLAFSLLCLAWQVGWPAAPVLAAPALVVMIPFYASVGLWECAWAGSRVARKALLQTAAAVWVFALCASGAQAAWLLRPAYLARSVVMGGCF